MFFGNKAFHNVHFCWSGVYCSLSIMPREGFLVPVVNILWSMALGMGTVCILWRCR